MKNISKKIKKTGYRSSFFRDKLKTKHINKCRATKMAEGKCYQGISNANLRQITFRFSSNSFFLQKEVCLDIIYSVSSTLKLQDECALKSFPVIAKPKKKKRI